MEGGEHQAREDGIAALKAAGDVRTPRRPGRKRHRGADELDLYQ